MIALDKNIGGYLQQAFRQNRAAHAYIVVGDKLQLPTLLKQCAMVCMCKNHLSDSCETCKKVLQDIHQDVLRFPKEGKQRILVEDMQLLVEESYKRPVDDSACRVFLINAANSVAGVGAEVWQNKLLKTLEEPIEGTYLFIGVTDAEGLLPTIRSRCQILHQTKQSNSEVAHELSALGIEKRFCQIAACVSCDVNAAQALLANPASLRAFDNAVAYASQMTSTKNAVQFVTPVLQDKDTVVQFLAFLTVLYRESIVYRLSPELCLLPAFEQQILQICQNYTLQAAEVCIELVHSAKKKIEDGGNLAVVVDNLTNSVLEVKYRCRQ